MLFHDKVKENTKTFQEYLTKIHLIMIKSRVLEHFLLSGKR